MEWFPRIKRPQPRDPAVINRVAENAVTAALSVREFEPAPPRDAIVEISSDPDTHRRIAGKVIERMNADETRIIDTINAKRSAFEAEQARLEAELANVRRTRGFYEQADLYLAPADSVPLSESAQVGEGTTPPKRRTRTAPEAASVDGGENA